MPGGLVDLTELPELWPQVVSWLRCQVTLKPGVLGTPALPPLRASREMFAVVPEVLAVAEHWGG